METAVKDLLALLKIPGVPAEEEKIAAHVKKTLRSIGVQASAITQDQAYKQSEFGGKTGNLMVKFPGQGKASGPSVVLFAHLDTVPLASGCKPVFLPGENGGAGKIVNGAKGTALGGDNRTGCAILLQVARALMDKKNKRPRPDVHLVFFIQEEVGLVGSRGWDPKSLKLKGPAQGFNFDGCDIDKIVAAVTGTTRFDIKIYGKPAHSGENPEEGISTLAVAAQAISDLEKREYHGRIKRDGGEGSGNVGVIQGGSGTNVIMEYLYLKAEVRSHDSKFRGHLHEIYKQAFTQAAADTKNIRGEAARAEFSMGPCYESFALKEDAPVIQTALRAARACGINAEVVSNNGGMDSNWTNVKGIPTASFGCGQRKIHTADEWIEVGDFLKVCKMAEELVYA